jgi:O-antigen ligase
MFMPDGPTRAEVEALFVRQRAIDPLGMRVHDALAGFACLCAAGPTTAVEWGVGPVVLCALIRLTGHRHMPGPLVWDWVVRLLVAFVALALLSRVWTLGSSGAWLSDVESMRFALLVPAIYMVTDRRTMLVRCITIGMLVGVLTQLGELAAQWTGSALLERRFAQGRMPGRMSGWWDPVVGGSLLCAALGLVLGAALLPGSTRRARAQGLVLSAAFIVGIALTGTRGAWIAAAGLVAVTLTLAAWRLVTGVRGARRESSRSSALIAIAVAILVCLIGAAAIGLSPAGAALRQRAERGVAEVQSVIERRDYASDTGMRLAMWWWALDAARSQPVAGVGAGGYQAHCARRRASADPEVALTLPPRPHAHAHSWYLHTLATLGVTGLALLLAILVLGIRSGLRDHLGFAAGPALGLVGLALAGLFDPISINQQTACLWCIVLTLCLPARPPERSAMTMGVDEAHRRLAHRSATARALA